MEHYRKKPDANETEFNQLFFDRATDIAKRLDKARINLFREFELLKKNPDYIRLQAMRRDVIDSDRFQLLDKAKQLAEGNFPIGNYLVRFIGEEPVKLSVLPADARIVRLMSVGHKPIEFDHVSTILTSLENLQTRPGAVLIEHSERVSGGYFDTRRNGREARTVALGIGESKAREFGDVFDHETGHLFIARRMDRSAMPDNARVTNMYIQGLRDVAPKIAKQAGVEATPAWTADFVAEMLSLPNDYTPPHVGLNSKMNPRYFVCFEEVFAEHFMLRAQQLRYNQQGLYPTYEELLRLHTKSTDNFRGELLEGFGPLYDLLGTTVHEPFCFRKTETLEKKTK